MCIAIYKPAGVAISKKTLQTSFRNNPDGAGFALAYKGRLTVRKGYFTFREFWADYTKTVNKTNGAAIIHFRIATHGAVDHTNCHPFSVNKELAFIHNGIINIDIVDHSKSDTSHFNDYFVKPLVADFGNGVVQSAAVQNLLGASVGDSKLIFLDRLGNYAIINEDLGYWDGGAWYSNKSYCRAKYYSQGYSQYGFWNGKTYTVTEADTGKDENYADRIAKRDAAHDATVAAKDGATVPFEMEQAATLRTAADIMDADSGRNYPDCMLPGDTGGYSSREAADARELVDELLGDDMQERGGDYADADRREAYGQKKTERTQRWCANCQTYSIVRANNLCMVCGMDANGGIADFSQTRGGIGGRLRCQRCPSGFARLHDPYCEECRYTVDTVNANYIERQIEAGRHPEPNITADAGGFRVDQVSTANN